MPPVCGLRRTGSSGTVSSPPAGFLRLGQLGFDRAQNTDRLHRFGQFPAGMGDGELGDELFDAVKFQ
ncbi:hypothetical protein GCM10027018_20640 [Paenibacillus thermoaerophilus]